MKILITGAAGQLGNELRCLLEAEHPGVATYTDLAELDLTDSRAVLNFVADGGYTHIVNCSAYTAVDRAEDEKIQCTQVNVDGVRNLATAAAQTGARLVHISTDYVFDGTACRPYAESDKPAPLSHYGSSKRKGETALLGLLPDAVIIRTGWLYSTFGHNFVKTISRKIVDGEKLRVVSDQIGTPTYAADLARMIKDVIFAPQWLGGTYHFSNEGVASWYDLAVAIAEEMNRPEASITPVSTTDYPTVATRPFYSVLDKTKIKATYGVTIPHWRNALRRCIAALNTQQNSHQQ